VAAAGPAGPPAGQGGVVVAALVLRYAARQVPREVLLEAWPGKPEVIERLLGVMLQYPLVPGNRL
jgi:hypothetical protein